MQIHKIRKGFATNSSSTHSLLILAPGQRATDYLADGDFGWDFFTAASPAAKKRYMAIQLRDAMRGSASDAVIKSCLQDWVGFVPEDDDYIDHQSNLLLPYEWEGRSVDREFFQEFLRHVMRDEVVIAGGNDNTDSRHPLEEEGATPANTAVPRDSHERFICRRDSRGFWTLFSRDDGTKVRLSLEDPSDKTVDPAKADAPELVDVKITDFCTFGCTYCYQGSDRKGQHASWESLGRLALSLAELKVFEVAIGGGEPTMHPDFWRFVRLLRDQHIVPSFTTRSLAWLRDPEKVALVKDACGGFGVSIDEGSDDDPYDPLSAAVQKAFALAKAAGIADKMVIHYVVGSVREGTAGVMKACSDLVPCLLLGYKATGRGESFEPRADDWIATLKDLRNRNQRLPRIDTALAARHQDAITELGFPSWCFEIKEGKFSMYVDLVAQKSAPSSYDQERAMVPLEGGRADWAQEIQRAFAAF